MTLRSSSARARVLFCALLLAPPVLALASAAPAPTPEGDSAKAKFPERPSSYSVFPGSEAYPQSLADQGAQGFVDVRVALAEDGRLTDPVIVATSGSEELDQAAIRIAGKLGYKADASEPRPESINLRIEFVKDSLETLAGKTCAELNKDYSWSVQHRPGLKPSEMPVFKLASVAVVAIHGLKVEIIMGIKKAAVDTVAACASQPEEGFLSVYLRQFKLK